MELEIAASVLEHNFDQAMLAQIDTLRTVRLNLAESMLRNLDVTGAELVKRGLVDPAGDADDLRKELKRELTDRITTLRERIKRPDVIYTDEISLYADLLENADGEASFAP